MNEECISVIHLELSELNTERHTSCLSRPRFMVDVLYLSNEDVIGQDWYPVTTDLRVTKRSLSYNTRVLLGSKGLLQPVGGPPPNQCIVESVDPPPKQCIVESVDPPPTFPRRYSSDLNSV